jgi:ribosomal protein S14
MIDQLEKPRNFGVHHKPPCANCGQPTSLIRRSPSDFDRRYERQIFACFKCGHEIERVVDVEGNSRL